ncbi:MAG: mono/diheme cytochrome c family protein [Bacteroidia bacterium]|jgi:mono/diheme cytochrome c family protein
MRTFLLLGSLLYTFFLTAPVTANPVFPDENSLLRGADVYAMHCAECHGWTILERYRARDMEEEYAPEFDYENLVNEAHGVADIAPDELVYMAEEKEAWPEWAEFPDPEAAGVPSEREQAMEDITAAIDSIYGDELDGLEADDAADELAESEAYDINGPIAGATELQRANAFYFGTSEQALYDSISQGNGAAMPAFRDVLASEEAIWDLVNFIRSFWTDEELEY